VAIYVVGDIQGCYDQLRRLLDKAAFDPARDQLWTVGDLVNRGPKSLATLRFLRSLGAAFASVQGNHDLHFLATASGAYTGGKIKTLRPLLDAPDCMELFEWVRQMPLARIETVPSQRGPVQYLIVHAGVLPQWNFGQALAYGAEVEAVLRSTEHRRFLAGMYGDKPDTWEDTLTGMERLRVITNVLTRLRFCTPEGRLDFAAKEGVNTAPPGFRPWYEFQTLQSGQQILFGHWAALEGRTGNAAIHALDTGCVWGHCLTVLRLDDGERISVSCHDV
jgi:bis(5'-nucleosyl)-tetraphosphatase (symmetrical)